MPEDHPAKTILDDIFAESRAILNIQTMQQAGFIDPYPRKFTRLVVTKHPLLEGYVIKTYLDAQRYYKKKPEHYYWTLRIKGAEAIQKMIEQNGWQAQFKVPQTWIYAIPKTFAPPRDYLAKNYILVEEDMQLHSHKENKRLWGSAAVSEELLDHLFNLLNELGLHDCASIDNIPFAFDGRIAFIDTQTFNQWPIEFGKLSPYLIQDRQVYWGQLMKNYKKRN